MKSSFNQIPNKLTMFEVGCTPAKSNSSNKECLPPPKKKKPGFKLSRTDARIHTGTSVGWRQTCVYCDYNHTWLCSVTVRVVLM